jgi:hypothetical protein
VLGAPASFSSIQHCRLSESCNSLFPRITDPFNRRHTTLTSSISFSTMAPPVDIHDHDSYDGAEYVTPRGIISGSTDFTSLSRFDRMFAFMSVTSLFFIWGLSYGLVDVLNKHFLDIFSEFWYLDHPRKTTSSDLCRLPDLTKTQSTLLQFAYFGAYLVFSPIMGVFMRLVLEEDIWSRRPGGEVGLSTQSPPAVSQRL